MNYSDQPPSQKWAPIKYKGRPIAEVWFKPGGDPYALTLRVPRESFGFPDLLPLLTPENLLKAVGLSSKAANLCPQPDSRQPLDPPAEGQAHLVFDVRLQPFEVNDGGAETKWQALRARWNIILGLEATLDTLRLSMESLRAEMESTSTRSLSADEKLHASNADIAQWNKARTRITHSLPKARDFIHRATWVAGAPERKVLDEVFKPHAQPPDAMDNLGDRLEQLLKDRQVLSSHGTTTYQECKGVLGEAQAALRTLKGNSAANATRKRGQANKRGKGSLSSPTR